VVTWVFANTPKRFPNTPASTLTLLLDEVDAAYERLTALGVVTEGPPEFHERFGITHFFARDPNGYRLELQRFLDPLG
jgi:catechol 2,3-dioxygenase-like lactoylglutathione lyase family enzyme